MRKKAVVAMMALTGAMVLAQQVTAPPAAAVGSTPKVKSKEEAAAIKKVTEAKSADEKIAAVDALVTGFADTVFKSVALMEAAEAEDSKSDYVKAVSYGELAIQADPMQFYGMILVAGELAQHTGKYDLDKEEKLGKAEKYVAQALAIIPTATKPAGGGSDADWNTFKKDQTANAYKDLGLVAQARGKYDEAAKQYQLSVDTAASPDTVTMARLANSYNEIGKYTEALAMATKVLKIDGLNPTVKQFAEQQQQRAQKGLAAKK
jgi:tetratricopeptide (TPR) repeat protein